MKTSIAIIISTFISFFSLAQNPYHFEVELDPLAYALSGASGHAALAWNKQRVQVGLAQLPLPEALQNNEGVAESFRAISFKWDYFLSQSHTNGMFVGPTADVLFLEYENTAGTFNDEQLSLGIRTGYKLDLFKGQKTLSALYLTPWVGFSWMLNADDFSIDEVKYSRKSFTVFPTFHLGWRF